MDVSVLPFPAGIDTNLGHNQRLSSTCFDELLLAWHLATEWRHGPVVSELTIGGRLVRSRAHSLVRREGSAVLLGADANRCLDNLAIWQSD